MCTTWAPYQVCLTSGLVALVGCRETTASAVSLLFLAVIVACLGVRVFMCIVSANVIFTNVSSQHAARYKLTYELCKGTFLSVSAWSSSTERFVFN